MTSEELVAWYREIRARTKALFRIPHESAYYDRPIPLRNPIVFYEGHLPAFAVNTLVKWRLGGKGIDAGFETLFARGIDPEDDAAVKDPAGVWPQRAEVQAYGAAAERMIEQALFDDDAAYTILEHELMHQETLLYMLHQLPYEKKHVVQWSRHRPGGGPPPSRRRLHIPAGAATLGKTDGFGWDNEFPPIRVEVEAFSIDAHSVTNGDYLEYVKATGAKLPHFWTEDLQWRGMFSAIPLPLDWPVYVTYDEATAYARWKGRRLPTEAEYHRAAFSTPEGGERAYPWGDDPPDETRGNFDFANWDPVPAGCHPAGASAWGVHDLVGNGWEWTSTVFAGFPGFAPMPSYPLYSVDFFDGAHYVLKGASPATPRELIRRSFRNWFRPGYPYVFAKFRCAE